MMQEAPYKLLEVLGRGSFGQVVKCLKKDTDEAVAIKILKDDRDFAEQGLIEIGILSFLHKEKAHQFNCVQMHDYFYLNNNLCLVFEILEQNLFEYLEGDNFRPLPIRRICYIVEQILIALVKLKDLGVIHADLKPENIMMVDPIRQPDRIKVIDFSCSLSVGDVYLTTQLQSRYYRAPEILLGLLFSEAIDIWSLGCIMAELLLGDWPLYPGTSQYDQMWYICETQGLPPEHVLTFASNPFEFFNMDMDGTTPVWRLKTPEEYEAETRVKSKETRKYVFSRLDDVGYMNLPTEYLEEGKLLAVLKERQEFTDLLKRMLAVDQGRRITASEALNHAFMAKNGATVSADTVHVHTTRMPLSQRFSLVQCN